MDTVRSLERLIRKAGMFSPLSCSRTSPDGCRVHVIGRSEQGRPLTVVPVGDEGARRRALVIAGQHGDEPLAAEVLESLATDTDWQTSLHGVEIFLLPSLNPDGRVHGTRANAAGVDLNRDHQVLHSRETAALHAYCHALRPELIIDVHTFRARRRTWLAQGFEIGEDIMFELENHPSSLGGYAARRRARLDPLISSLCRRGIGAAQYVLVRGSGRIRTSSSDVVDARNGLSLSLGVSTLLVEGREPTRRWGSAERTRGALRQAVVTALEHWESEGRSNFASKATSIPHLGAKRVRSQEPVRRRTVVEGDRAPVERSLDGRNDLGLEATDACVLPAAYGVPLDRTEVHALLARHGWTGRPVMGAVDVRRARVLAVQPSRRPSRAPHGLQLKWSRHTARPGEFLFYTADGSRRPMLASLLEPTSRYGVHRHAEFRLALAAQEAYPVVKAVDFPGGED